MSLGVPRGWGKNNLPGLQSLTIQSYDIMRKTKSRQNNISSMISHGKHSKLTYSVLSTCQKMKYLTSILSTQYNRILKYTFYIRESIFYLSLVVLHFQQKTSLDFS